MSSLLNKLERVFGRFAIANLSLFLVAGQVAVFLCGMLLHALSTDPLVLVPVLVLQGEWWRVLTFLLIPPPVSWIFIAFSWWIFYLMGSALEDYWGVFRYNLFLFIGWVLTVGAAYLTQAEPATNLFVAGSVFLAFAYLNPDFELVLFFILPVKVKWLALLTWVGYAVVFFRGEWSTRCQVLATVGNFLLFFGRDIFLSARLHRRRMTGAAQGFGRSSAEPEARHRCRICGKTELTDPQLDFRYCSKCVGEHCYCSEHIFNHEHVLTDEKAKV
jgi:membrane associated rhomboid family serine protease